MNSQLCIVCQTSYGEMTRLRNGESIHEKCLYINEKSEAKSIESELNSLRYELRNIRPNYGFWGSLFGDHEEDRRTQDRENQARSKIDQREQELLSLLEIIKDKQRKLDPMISKIIAHWPGYPPEAYWNSLRRNLAQNANHRCEKCKKYTPLEKGHAHHKEPLRLGGLNTISNLSWLCRTCHETKHSHRFPRERQSSKASVSGVTAPTTKLQKIDYCLSSNSHLRIKYRKPNGAVSERTVKVIRRFHEKPPGRRRWLVAYCFKRKDERTFNIERIEQAEIVKKQ